ncbi:MAG: ATP-binding cassette domain-containing protein [Peptococcaceae bacterium]
MSVSFHLKKQLDRFALDVEYQFPQGVLVVQGESGSGKSTLLNCISGLLQPDDGYMQLGQRLLYQKQEQIDVPVQQRNIGYVFQNYALFPNMTVEKNILYGVNNRARDGQQRQEMLDYVTYIMDTFRIQHLRKKYPRQISGGEKQRTALARAIVTKPDLLLLDEPFSALDIKTKEIVYQEFLELKHAVQIPIILISHDPREGDLFADHRLYLADGHISTAI